MSEAEEAVILQKHGSLPEVVPGTILICSKKIDGRCSIYEDRPLICRLYGSVDKFACPHGCKPTGGFLPERKARKLLARAEILSPNVKLTP
jgi:hypothetical protein